ncbi:MAG TPA: endolytic transglycosylase MltG, partial [Microlunatus sp.]
MTSLLDQEPEKRSRTAARRGKGCLAVLVALAILVGGGFLAWQKVSGAVENALATPDYTTKRGVADVKVTVPEGASLTAIGTQLADVDVIKSTKAFSKAIQDYDGQPTVQAGSYKMRTQLPAAVALKRLTTPQKYRIRNQIQVLEGLRLSEQVAALAKATKIPAKKYRAALAKPADLGLPAWAKNRPQGFLFPDSYELTDGATATTVLQQMTGRFNQVSSEVDLPAGAASLNLTPYQVVTV